MTGARDIEEIVADAELWATIPDAADCLALLADWRAKKAEIERLREDEGPSFQDIDQMIEDAAEDMRARCEVIAREYEAEIGELGPTTADHIADAIAALKPSDPSA